MARLNSRLANRRAGGPVAQPAGREPMAIGASPSAAVTVATSPGSVGAVGVGEHEQFTLSFQHAGTHPMALAMVRLAADDPHPVISCCDGLGDGEGLVGRPVIHDQDLDRVGLS